MLRGLRKASSNWLGKLIMSIVMGVLIVSFGIWGIADIFRGFGQSTAAKVGHVEISAEAFRRTYTDRLQQISRQFGRPLTSEQARAFGFDRQVLQQMMAEAALDEDARRLGLGQSDAAVRKMVLDDPNFKGPTGTFDPNRFTNALREFGYSEQRYMAEQRQVSLRRQIANTVTAGNEPSKTMIDAANRFQNETRTVEYVKLDAGQAGTIAAPSPETLASYFDDHKALFRAPEYRKLSFVAVTPEEIAKSITISDEEARKSFETRLASLSTPEQRQVAQIVFPNMDEAKAARDRITAGTSFDDIAKERNLTPSDTDLGLVKKSDILDPATADAAFSLAAGEVSQPVQGKFGVVLVRVSKIEPGSQPTYDSVAATIKHDLAVAKAQTQVASLRDKMEDERGGGASVLEAAQKLGLNAVTVEAVDRSGQAPDGKPVAGIPDGLNLISAAFNSDVGADNDALPFAGGYVWYDVLGITPSHDRSLDEVKDKVEARWHDDQVNKALEAKGAEMVTKLMAGGKLADEAAASGLKVETTAPFKRDAKVAGLPDRAVEVAFRTAKDAAGQAQGNGTEWVVFRVTDITVPPLDPASAEAKRLTDTLQRGLNDEQIQQYVTKLESEIGTSVNDSVVAQVTGAANSSN
jgi:peptidyl-prolyl cis-trans isomerase D